jgi:hypothetical protein
MIIPTILIIVPAYNRIWVFLVYAFPDYCQYSLHLCLLFLCVLAPLREEQFESVSSVKTVDNISMIQSLPAQTQISFPISRPSIIEIPLLPVNPFPPRVSNQFSVCPLPFEIDPNPVNPVKMDFLCGLASWREELNLRQSALYMDNICRILCPKANILHPLTITIYLWAMSDTTL